MRERPVPPHPEIERRPPRSFGWLDARLLHEQWLEKLGPEPVAVMTLLALAADRHGVSFYRRETMAVALGMRRREMDRCLERLVDLGLVAHRPWTSGHIDGVWQLMPLPNARRSQ